MLTQKEKTLKCISYLTLTSIILFCVVGIIIWELDFDISNKTTKYDPLKTISPLEIANLVFTLAIAGMGFISFSLSGIKPMIVYLIFVFISICLNATAGVYAICIGSKKDSFESFGCELKGNLCIWSNMDSYIRNADKVLCSPKCFCQGKVKSVLDCSDEAKKEIYYLTKMEEPSFDEERNFSLDLFGGYMKNIEKKFNCAGWCEKSVTKLIFSDVNEKVLTQGCVEEVVNWIPKYFIVNGICVLIQMMGELIVFSTGITFIIRKKYLNKLSKDNIK